MSSNQPNSAVQAAPPLVQQITPEFAAYVEQVLHREIEKVHQNAQERQNMEVFRVAREQALQAEYEQREQAYRREIEALRVQLQEQCQSLKLVAPLPQNKSEFRGIGDDTIVDEAKLAVEVGADG
ncbi:hypothetical protein NEOLEDRAFT_1182465 [Neolentinus lepideus HHB14362 ss-1]|uniref:Uncharacterized protein n=1 Tax=Neolentinus lepideus HHB14362 ss-1 TaxID=1314782 RepID=A0A165P4C2_9AGAM|nr:hypothetical protein NEOLEDRAFT_1182465 [Neolentinus lepideus HHB14362 ss-1]